MIEERIRQHIQHDTPDILHEENLPEETNANAFDTPENDSTSEERQLAKLKRVYDSIPVTATPKDIYESISGAMVEELGERVLKDSLENFFNENVVKAETPVQQLFFAELLRIIHEEELAEEKELKEFDDRDSKNSGTVLPPTKLETKDPIFSFYSYSDIQPQQYERVMSEMLELFNSRGVVAIEDGFHENKISISAAYHLAAYLKRLNDSRSEQVLEAIDKYTKAESIPEEAFTADILDQLNEEQSEEEGSNKEVDDAFDAIFD